MLFPPPTFGKKMTDPSKCAVIVPCHDHIEYHCDEALRALEGRGYQVFRKRGISNIDFGRSKLATDILAKGFTETMWIDSDVRFNPDDVERLRAHNLPFVCGLYVRKVERRFTCTFPSGTRKITFGPGGGLTEVEAVGMGFNLIRKDVFDKIRAQLALPACYEGTKEEVVPYFLSMVIKASDNGFKYLFEDYSFCLRARVCGFKIMADTRIQLWHIGPYGYSWETLTDNKSGTFDLVNDQYREEPEAPPG
jgi:hypothetical protein